MKRLRFYAYEQNDAEAAVLKLVDLSEGATRIGPIEQLQQRVLSDPRWRRLYELTLPPGLETAAAADAIRSADGIEILEETDG